MIVIEMDNSAIESEKIRAEFVTHLESFIGERVADEVKIVQCVGKTRTDLTHGLDLGDLMNDAIDAWCAEHAGESDRYCF